MISFPNITSASATRRSSRHLRTPCAATSKNGGRTNHSFGAGWCGSGDWARRRARCGNGGESNGFLCLAETEHEVVYGQAGRFWSPNERAALVSPRTIEEFRGLSDPRFAVAAMNIAVEALAPARTRLFTETRVRCLGASSRRRFRLYWLVIRPFSGLLRRAMLRGIKTAALRDARHARLTVEY